MTMISFWMTFVFILGYLLITIEHVIHVNKAAIALLMAIALWTLQFFNPGFDHHTNMEMFGHHFQGVSQIVFFLLGALIIVEVISMHEGFQVITNKIRITSKKKLLWTLGGMAFILSGILDNLTTTVVMVSLLGKLMEKSEDRMIIGGGIVVAANAGGAWTPIGDVTTTMLWIGEQVSAVNIMKSLFLPSLVCMLVSFFIFHRMVHGKFEAKIKEETSASSTSRLASLFFYLGVALLIFVPFFKIMTGLPPFMGILLGVAILWMAVDLMHRHVPEEEKLTMAKILSHTDLISLLFFLGILLGIDALDSAGILRRLADTIDSYFNSQVLIATMIGLASAVVDNVPLVAAAMGMYDLAYFPQDSEFWQLVAYCAGTGGSILIIGSAAGVVYMGLEKASFFWYLRRISLPALMGYLAGIAVYLMMHR